MPGVGPCGPGRPRPAPAGGDRLLRVAARPPDQAWGPARPDLQAQDRERYEKVLERRQDLRLVTPPQVNGDTVTVQLEYTIESRGRIRETHQLGMLVAGDTVLINSDRVVSSHTIPGDNKDKDTDEGPGGGGGN